MWDKSQIGFKNEAYLTDFSAQIRVFSPLWSTPKHNLWRLIIFLVHTALEVSFFFFYLLIAINHERSPLNQWSWPLCCGSGSIVLTKFVRTIMFGQPHIYNAEACLVTGCIVSNAYPELHSHSRIFYPQTEFRAVNFLLGSTFNLSH